jgi:hypothetical protein
MLRNLFRWVKKSPEWATLLIALLAVVLIITIATGTILGIIGKSKLDTANTNLWASGQQNQQLRASAQTQNAQYEEVIERLRGELQEFRNAAATERAMTQAENLTPETVWKFTGTSNLTIRVNGDVAPRVRPSPRASDVSHGRLDVHARFTLEYFYATPNRPQDGIGNWIGIPVHLLSENELRSFPSEIAEDRDGIIWVSADYLRFSDYLRNYTSEQVNLRADIATSGAN